jgi:mono/diheme cytochrome c family protein
VTAERGRAVFAAMGCGTCHTLAAAGSTGELGPNLDERLAAHTPASLRAAVVSPPVSMMPDDFGARLDERQLDALTQFLVNAATR